MSVEHDLIRFSDASRIHILALARDYAGYVLTVKAMTQTRQYHGTTVTEFVGRHFKLLVALALFLALSLGATRLTTTLPGRAGALFALCVTALLWLALIFQCLRARPWTALMELLALVLLLGFGATLVAWAVYWWPWRVVAVPVVGYMGLFLVLEETGMRRYPAYPDRRDYQAGVRLLCLLCALLLAYVFKS